MYKCIEKSSHIVLLMYITFIYLNSLHLDDSLALTGLVTLFVSLLMHNVFTEIVNNDS